MFERDGLRAQVLFHRKREVSAALYGRVVGDDDAGAAMNPADARNESCGRRVGAVHAVCGECRELEECTARIKQRLHALARQELAAGYMLAARFLRAAATRTLNLRTQGCGEFCHARVIGAKAFAFRFDLRRQSGHGRGSLGYTFDGDGNGFTAADTKSCDALCAAASRKRM